jgi:hypothetical protein
MEQRFIVAEISKNWPEIPEPDMRRLLAERFEDVINNNWKRGYRLLSWKLNRSFVDRNTLNETIIAIFEARDRGQNGGISS